jgi:hypothetical protein
MNTRDVLLLIAGAGAIGAVFYAVNASAKPASSSAPTQPTVPPNQSTTPNTDTSSNTSTLIPNQATQAAPLLGDAYVIVQLPTGAVWAASSLPSSLPVVTAGTSTPVQLPAGTYTLNWVGVDGSSQSTTLTVS